MEEDKKKVVLKTCPSFRTWSTLQVFSQLYDKLDFVSSQKMGTWCYLVKADLSKDKKQNARYNLEKKNEGLGVPCTVIFSVYIR